MQFADFNLEDSIIKSLEEMGFKEPTKIQRETIPLIKAGNDVIGQSETGSGKTGAFGIPLVEKVTPGIKTQALILCPTRELAIQITGELEKFSKHKGLRIQCVYGGVPMGPQINGIRRAEIVVGTPGRVMDHINRGNLDLSNVHTFILDEADRMIDMGCIDDIQAISAYVPKERQTLLFSATMPGNLTSICDRITREPKRVKTATKVREEDLKQYYCEVDRQSKFSLLVHLLKKEDPELGIIFCNRRSDVDLLAQNLRYNSINAEALHGGLTQSRRENTIERFHGGQIDVLVATDVAARGLDFKDVTHIFNYSVPNNPEDYVNRIGRTARAGKTGKAIVLLTREDFDSLSRVVNTFDYDMVEIEVKDYERLPFRRGEGGRGRFGGERRGGNGGNGRRFGGSRRQEGYGGGYGGDRDGRRRSYGGGNGGSGYGRNRDRGYGGSRSRDGYFGGSGERRGGYGGGGSRERSGPRQQSCEASTEGNSILSQGYSERRNSGS